MAPEKLPRIAVVNSDRCKPKKCRQECKRGCPVVMAGDESVFIQSDVLEVALDMREKFDPCLDGLLHVEKTDPGVLCDEGCFTQ